MSGGSPRVLWVTNLAPPYRIPVWQALGAKVRLEIGLLEPTKRFSSDVGANRGLDWRHSGAEGFDTVEFSTFRLKAGEARYYGFYKPSFRAAVDRADALILAGWESPAYWQLLLAAKIRGKATVGFYESTLGSQNFKRGPIRWMRNRFFSMLDRIVVPGQGAAEAIYAMGVPKDRVVVGFNAVNTEAFRNPPLVENAAGHRFLYVGQLIARKSVDRVVNSFAKAASAHDTLTIIGKGETRETLQGLADSLGVADRVRWIEHVPNAELPALMGAHDTLVLASSQEVWGLVVNEALAAGMQVVVTRNCGVVDSIEHMAGVFVADADARNLTAKMLLAVGQFAGRIQDPEIIAHTPVKFADRFTVAVEQAISSPHTGPFTPRGTATAGAPRA